MANPLVGCRISTTYSPNGAFPELLRNFGQIPTPIGAGAGIPMPTPSTGSTCEGVEAPVTLWTH